MKIIILSIVLLFSTATFATEEINMDTVLMDAGKQIGACQVFANQVATIDSIEGNRGVNFVAAYWTVEAKARNMTVSEFMSFCTTILSTD